MYMIEVQLDKEIISTKFSIMFFLGGKNAEVML